MNIIRILDFIFALFGLLLAMPLLAALYIIGLFDTGSPLFRQERVGKEKRPFMLMKFRTMKVGTASVATHLADASTITTFGNFLRRTKLDELPQLWNVLRGEMSLVGPRPCLPTQLELIQARDSRQVFKVRPGITGLAQVQSIDMSSPIKLATTDAKMLESLALSDYFNYILQTISGRGQGDKVVPSK